MKRPKIFFAMVTAAAIGSSAADFSGVVSADSTLFTRRLDKMEVAMDLRLADLKVKSNEAVVITPRIVSASDTVEMPSVGIYGRRRYIYYIRNHAEPISGDAERSFRDAERPADFDYKAQVPFKGWMDGAQLEVACKTYGCCNKQLSERIVPLSRYEEFNPVYFFMRPVSRNVEKTRNLEGSAFIDFEVNRTEIKPDYRKNVVELGKINATIDSVRSDGDVTISQVWLKGFASPESPYEHNAELARGRVAALKSYVQRLYNFADTVVVTDYEPEDWAGLRRAVENSDITHKDEILEIIDCDLEPDPREWRLKSRYPEEYRFMLQNWYPALRHTDYRIVYTIRSYKDPAEIAQVMEKDPSKLSLNEFYLLSNSYEPGSDEFDRVWRVALAFHPDDTAANFNAAVNAMQRGELEAARRYLLKAGNTPQAEYARGIYDMLGENYGSAYTRFEKARDGGVDEASEAIKWLERNKKESITKTK